MKIRGPKFKEDLRIFKDAQKSFTSHFQGEQNSSDDKKYIEIIFILYRIKYQTFLPL